MNIGQRGKLLRKIVTQVRDHEYPYEKRPEKKVNWTNYDLAQVNELADMLDLIRELVDAADANINAQKPPVARGRGRPPTNAADIAKILIAQSYFGISNRVAEGMLRVLWRNLGLKSVFSYKTIERGYDREAVNEILDEVQRLSNIPVQNLEKAFSIDGTGTPTHMKQNYALDRERQNRERKGEDDTDVADDSFPEGQHDYVYSVSVVGVKYKLFASFQNTNDHSLGEQGFFPNALAETKASHPKMELMTGDANFAFREACTLVEQAGALPRFFPKRNLTFKSHGSYAWVRMLLDFSNEPDKWLREYYQREASETVNSMVKMEHPNPLRKRLDERRLTEDYLRCVDHNVRRLCYLMYLVDLPVDTRNMIAET